MATLSLALPCCRAVLSERNGYATAPDSRAGSGDDQVNARNGRRETVRCGPGDDTVRADGNDRLRGCEHVVRAG